MTTLNEDRVDGALSVRDALTRLGPSDHHECDVPLTPDTVAAHFAANFAGVPAVPAARSECAVRYTGVGEIALLLGLYGDEPRVRRFLPGFPVKVNPLTARQALAEARTPVTAVRDAERLPDLSRLPILRTTPRDAGRYLTMGIVQSGDALSVHRMLVLDDDHLAIWMLPSRHLRARYLAATERGERLPVTINLGAPPAAMIAASLGTRFLPDGTTKLDVAGAFAGAPLALAPAVSQPEHVLATSEIVIEGHLDGTTSDEATTTRVSMPEFLGYDGTAQRDLPVITVTAVTARPGALYQATIGPGREQSVILGMAGAVSTALSLDDPTIADLHHTPAGGGMLTLVAAVTDLGPDANQRLAGISQAIFTRHPFTKLIIYVDDDVDIRNPEDVLWAMTTRANLGVDAVTLPGFRPLGMDPSHSDTWDRGGGDNRTFINATVPSALRDTFGRSFQEPG
ncbi:UbiD family decarboxylase [Actinomadura meridiana]|uniref:UbiD family decarboxylase n=1 Tax=Actinomadura meridiana TaxID=559626 RepID=A0ABP8CFL1_9ACTN